MSLNIAYNSTAWATLIVWRKLGAGDALARYAYLRVGRKQEGQPAGKIEGLK